MISTRLQTQRWFGRNSAGLLNDFVTLYCLGKSQSLKQFRSRMPNATDISKNKLKAMLRFASFMLLAFALIAPKVSLALSTIIGSGNRTVVICTGTGLKRVSISPSGEVVEDKSQNWAGSQCVRVSDDTELLQRAWLQVEFPVSSQIGYQLRQTAARFPQQILTNQTNRGPPSINLQ